MLDKEERSQLLLANENCNVVSDQACQFGLQNAKFVFSTFFVVVVVVLGNFGLYF